jgi:hypothetical protein
MSEDNPRGNWEPPTEQTRGAEQPAPMAGSGQQRSTEQNGAAERPDSRSGHMPWDVGSKPQPTEPSSSRVSVVDEAPPRPAPPPGSSEEEFKWHTYRSGARASWEASTWACRRAWCR